MIFFSILKFCQVIRINTNERLESLGSHHTMKLSNSETRGKCSSVNCRIPNALTHTVYYLYLLFGYLPLFLLSCVVRLHLIQRWHLFQVIFLGKKKLPVQIGVFSLILNLCPMSFFHVRFFMHKSLKLVIISHWDFHRFLFVMPPVFSQLFVDDFSFVDVFIKSTLV